MELFIRIKDGQPFEHPVSGDNFRQAFPHVDTANLPPEFARFERVPAPVVGVYEKLSVSYVDRGDGVYHDVWSVSLMTAAEKAAKQQEIKDTWATGGYLSWSFDEATCSFVPPVEMPSDEKFYCWNEATISWVEVI